jgi:uncharacterized protein (TIGR00661 family)
MKILYGVCGEGMGHAMRSAVVAAHLSRAGHDVRFVTSGNALKYLEARWPGKVTRTLGFGIQMEKNTVRPLRTFLSNAAVHTLAPAAHVASFLALGGRNVDAVISDFDFWSSGYARFFGIPCYAVDNVHFLNRCDHPRQLVAGDRTAASLMYPGVNAMVPDARRYLVTTFAGADIVRDRTTLHYPILRDKILAAPKTEGDHVAVYFNASSDHAAIARALQGVDGKFHFYGAPVQVDTQVGNVSLRPFDEDRFIADMASAKAVIGGAGFTLMTEAIYLGKPMLAAPFGGQFEQILNANYLQHLGYGERAYEFTPQSVSTFLGRADGYRQELRNFQHDGNRELLYSVDRALAGD